MKSFLLLTFIVTAFAGFCQQNCLVTRVIDGDTYKVLLNGKIQTVQLLNTDAPEKGQYFGKESSQHVAALIQGRMVAATFYDNDLYGRHIINIHIDGLRLDSILIARGWAFYNYNYSRDSRLWALETDAKIIEQVYGNAPTVYLPGSSANWTRKIRGFTKRAGR